jgi:hypothetical protein
MKGSPVQNSGVGNASLLNATIDNIGIASGCIAMRRARSARAIQRG